MIYLILGASALAYAFWMQYSALQTSTSLANTLYGNGGKRNPTPKAPSRGPIKYNPYLGDQQLVSIKDRIYCSDIVENNIERKPSTTTHGMYGLTQNIIKLNPADAPTIIYAPKLKLNI